MNKQANHAPTRPEIALQLQSWRPADRVAEFDAVRQLVAAVEQISILYPLEVKHLSSLVEVFQQFPQPQ